MTPRARLAAAPGVAMAFVAYLALSWFVANAVAVGAFRGSDWGNVVTIAVWLERHFPSMPFWYPYQGGGVSFTAGYAVWPIEWAVAVARLTGLDVTAALRLLAFLAVPFGATGCLMLARRVGSGPLAAFLAGLLFTLAPATWNVFYRIGFYSNAVAMCVAPWTVWSAIAYTSDQAVRLDRRGAARFAAAAVFTTLGVLAHPIIGLAVAGATLLAVLVTGWPRGRVVGRAIAWGLASLALSGGWLLGFAAYSVAADREGLNALDPSSAPAIPSANILELADIRHGVTDLLAVFTFPPALWALGLAGAVLGLRRRETRGIALTALVTFAVLVAGPVRDALYTLLRPLSPLFAQRGPFAVEAVLLPVLAAGLVPLVAGALPRGRRLATAAATVAFVVATFAGEGAGYGTWTAANTPTLGARLASPTERATLLAPPAPRVDPSTAFLQPFADAPRLGELLQTDGRSDLDPQLGGLLLGLDVATRARVVSLYTFQLSLIHEMWGDEQRQLYLPLVYGIAEPPIPEVAAWHGLDRVAFRADPSLERRYVSAGWRRVYDETAYADVEVEVWEAPSTTLLAATRSSGAVLYIGSPERRSYTNFFRLAGGGALPFATAWPVESTGYVDDYSADDLARFDALVLDGFRYHDRKKAYDLLEGYVRAGGSLFVDTGWQYVAADWQVAAPAPPVIPLERLDWRGVGATPALELRPDANGPPVDGIDAAALGDLTYGGGEWDVSTADLSDLRSWAHPVLVADGHPLIAAGRLGKGRIVWSGLNLTNHLLTKQSPAERELFARLLRWLLPSTAAPAEVASVVDDAGRGTVAAASEARWLLWREPAAFASARDARGTLPVYRAGPGYALIPVRGAGTISVAHEFPLGSTVAGYVSDAALVLLALWLVASLGAGGAADPGAAAGVLWGALRRRVRHVLMEDEETT